MLTVNKGLSARTKNRIDSLARVFETSTNDTSRLTVLIYIGESLFISLPDSAVATFNRVIDHSNTKLESKDLNDLVKKFYKKCLATAFADIGVIYQNTGNYHQSIVSAKKGLDIQREIGDEFEVSTSLNNIGASFINQGDMVRALQYLHESLKIRERLNNKKAVSITLNNIGSIYHNIGDDRNALIYYQKSLRMCEELGAEDGIAFLLNNIGVIYKKEGNYDKALDHYQKSLALFTKKNAKKGQSKSLSNIGSLYMETGKYEQALPYYKKSLEIQEELNDKSGISHVLCNMGSVYLMQKKFTKGVELGNKSILISKEIGNVENIKDAASLLYKLNKLSGQSKIALENYELYIQMRDSISNESNRKASIKSQLKYEYEKQAAADSVVHAKESEIKNAELARQKAEISAKKNQQYALFGGLGLVMIFAGFMYNRFKVTQKQKSIIEEQKEVVEEQKKLVEEKQKEVLDSIQYARRIQMALIPKDKRIEAMINRTKKQS